MSQVTSTSSVAAIPTVVGSAIVKKDCVADNGKQYIATKLPDGSIALFEPATGDSTAVEATKNYETIAGAIAFSDVVAE